MEKVYLGDSVYCEFNGYTFILTTENGCEEPSNTIVIEPEVATALLSFISRIKQSVE
jgi:hypothetical protein